MKRIKMNFDLAQSIIEENLPNQWNVLDFTKQNKSRNRLFTLQCKFCNSTYDKALKEIKNKHGCKECFRRKRLKTLDEIKKQSNLIHGDLYDFSNFIVNGTKIKSFIVCKKCNYIFKQSISYHLYQKGGCPKCIGNSFGENLVCTILDYYCIQYEREKTFSDCKYKKYLFFDFYIESTKTAIEYHGYHHYEQKTSKRESLQIIQKRDQIKKDYCIKNDIKLIEIDSREFNTFEKILDLFHILKIISYNSEKMNIENM